MELALAKFHVHTPKISIPTFSPFLTSVNQNPSLLETGRFFQSVITY